MAKTIASITVRIGATIDGLEKGLNDAAKSLRRSGRNLSRLGDSLTRSVSLPLAAIGGIGLKMAADLQTSFGKIENLVGVTGDTLEGFKKDVANISGQVGQSQQALSEALFVVTSAGERGANAIEILTQAAKASKIGMGETSDIARATTAVIQAYGSENIDAARAIDVLTATVREGNLEASALAPVLGNVVGLAAQMGVSFEEVGASVATFTRLGVSAENAVTGLSGLLGGLLKPSKQGAEALSRVGLSFEDVRRSIKEKGLSKTLVTLLKLFEGQEEALAAVIPNVQALRAALGTAGVQGEAYIEIAENIANSTGLVNQGFENASKSANAVFAKALVNLQNKAIELGNSLLPLATQLVSTFTKALGVLDRMPQPLKNVSVGLLAIVAATGPVLKGIGLFRQNLGALAGAAGMIVGKLNAARKAFMALNAAAQASVIGAVAAAVSVVVIAYNNMATATNAAAKSSARLKAAQADIGRQVATERAELEQLLKPLRESSTSTEDRKAALERLQNAYPGYFSNISAEKTDLAELTTIQDKLNAAILRSVAARKKNEALNDIYGQIIEKQLRIKQIENEGFSSLGGTDIFGLGLTGEKGQTDLLGIERLKGESTQDFAVRKAVESLKEEVKSLESEINTTTQSFDKLFSLGGSNAGGRTRPAMAGPVGENAGDDQVLSGANQYSEKIEETRAQILGLQALASELRLGILPPADVIERKKNLLMEIGQLNPIQNFLQEGGIEAATEKFNELTDTIINAAKPLTEFELIMQDIGQAIAQTSAQGEQSFKDLAKAALVSAAKVIKAKIAEGIAKAVSNALGTGPAGLILAPIAGALAAKLFGSLLGKFGIPGLAEGGLAYGETMAIVGDNPNARADPEVISPLSKLKKMIGNQAGAVNLTGQFRISGRDLVLLLDEAQQTQLRTKGV